MRRRFGSGAAPWPSEGSAIGRRRPEQRELDRAIVRAIAYADVFEYPLTAAEVHRYLVGARATRSDVERILANGRLVPRRVSRCGGYFTLPGREASVPVRRRREAIAAPLWARAQRYGRLIAALPFVRMVAVTGALASDNVDEGADIDYLIVTEAGRLWLCRAMVVALVRIAALRGDTVCPNYFLSENALALPERNLFTATELARMVPLHGLDVYRRMRASNGWAEEFLPNAAGPARDLACPAPWLRGATGLVERLGRTGLGALVDRWEMSRKLRRFLAHDNPHGEARFGVDWCKGHFDAHGQRILTAFAERLAAIGEHGPARRQRQA
jgi:hypothetical protein